jgi:alkaline phosphatase
MWGRLGTWALLAACALPAHAQDSGGDYVRELQKQAAETKKASWGRWGKDQNAYSSWTSHSNRLIPVYTFGIALDDYQGENSVYRDEAKVKALYGRLPANTVNPKAEYLDQTELYKLQLDAVAAGKKNVILIIFDGMDWQTTQAAAIYKSQKLYTAGRGSGLRFQDYNGVATDYGWYVTSPHNNGSNVDVNAQAVLDNSSSERGGYDANVGGSQPWARPLSEQYLMGQLRRVPHAVTDSASSATSFTSGIKTYNAAINVDAEGNKVEPIAHKLQRDHGFSIGVVTSVPISHATPAAAYSNNVHRDDYQDLTRVMIGLPSIAYRQDGPPGVDVLMGAGWGSNSEKEDKQGANYVPGNKFITDADLKAIDVENGGKYTVAQRTAGKTGREVLLETGKLALKRKSRYFGFFGVDGGQLPFQTADGDYNPHGTQYSEADRTENPTLSDMTRVALALLSQNKKGFWLMVEAGDVDWANHSNNLDNSIGAVLSGDDAFDSVIRWVEKNSAWDETAVILTADHGHFLVLEDPTVLLKPGADAAEEANAAEEEAAEEEAAAP